MKRMLKIGILLMSLILIQILSFEFVGKQTIHSKNFANHKILINHITSIGIYSKNELSKSQRKNIKTNLKENFTKIDFPIKNNDYVNNYRLNSDKLGISYNVNFSLFLFAKVDEEVGTYEYGETWKSEYYWILFRWFRIKRINTGQS